MTNVSENEEKFHKYFRIFHYGLPIIGIIWHSPYDEYFVDSSRHTQIVVSSHLGLSSRSNPFLKTEVSLDNALRAIGCSDISPLFLVFVEADGLPHLTVIFALFGASSSRPPEYKSATRFYPVMRLCR